MKRSTIILVAAILLALLASFWLGGEFVRRRELLPADTVYVEKWVKDSIPEKPDSVKVEIKYVYLPKAVPVHDTTEVHDTTAVHDSVLVEVPIYEKTYEGENYKATVRGFQPELIDIWLKQKETTITVPYRKRWSFTVGPQVGVGYTPSGLQPYAGIGVTYGYNF